MNGAARRVGRLKETLNLDNLDIEMEPDFNSDASPLQLMSPNVVQNKSLSAIDLIEKPNEPKIKAVANRNANCQDASQLPDEQEDELAPLPALKNKKKADPRRQSTAIFSMLEATTSGNGLLGDSELAIGDEDMELLIPLAKSNASLASKGINNLWVDPDTDDAMLEEALPEPTLAELHAVANAAATAAPSPQKRGTPGQSKDIFGVRDSVAMFKGFSLACDSSPGIDTVKEEDFLSPRNNNNNDKTVAAREEIPKTVEEKKEEPKAVVRKPSRLKPPSSSSSFFSHKTTSAPIGKAAVSVAPKAVKTVEAVDVQPKKQQQAPKPRETTTTTKIVEKVAAPVIEKKKPEPAKPQPQPKKLPPSRLPAVAMKSRLPRPAPPAASSTRPAPVAKPRPQEPRAAPAAVTKPKAPVATRVVAKTPIMKKKAVAVETVLASSSSSSPADDTPRTAHLKWLEAHPELAFGGGPKIANSPETEEVGRS
jgi:hypothetical protein